MHSAAVRKQRRIVLRLAHRHPGWPPLSDLCSIVGAISHDQFPVGDLHVIWQFGLHDVENLLGHKSGILHVSFFSALNDPFPNVNGFE